MHIGPIQLTNNLVMAPMAGVTDRPFRRLCRRFGAGLAVSEMVAADTSLWGSRKSQRRLDHSGESAPVAVQIVGADPVIMAQAARANVEHGAEIIDVNMGCPAKKVCRTTAGSALLRDEPLVRRILDAVVAAVPVPVTLKIRTGWDREHRNGVRIATVAEQAGVQALAVHGRTRACGYSRSAEYETIRAIKRAVGIPVLANGDIETPEQARRVLAYTGADGVMIGRAAQGRPWIFREIQHFLETGQPAEAPPVHWIRDVLLEHMESLYAFYGPKHGVRIARKHIAWYSRRLPDSAEFRAAMYRADRTEDQRQQVRAFFDRDTSEGNLAA